MTRREAESRIEKEFATARQAESSGNHGMVRVCARRAAGAAITFWLKSHCRKSWGVDAMNQLRSLQVDKTIPESVREAARRLTTKITEQFTPAFPTDPLEDSRIIIDFFLFDAV